jgi:hypothetical protein
VALARRWESVTPGGAFEKRAPFGCDYLMDTRRLMSSMANADLLCAGGRALRKVAIAIRRLPGCDVRWPNPRFRASWVLC